ncbi:hypothetical protein [Changpingibacter yushuensis]|uniref:hypothetical protein n=1 Tax=Changpingibacter yushuensis TaxID=2758440 RepID=UPI0015F750AF|nr:hypothetical protein [Changpingibacter yushuensis]
MDEKNDSVQANLEAMDQLDFVGWNNADWENVFSHYHTDDVLVDVKGSATTKGLREHIDAMKSLVGGDGTDAPQILKHPISFGSGEWTAVVGEFADGSRMVTIAGWKDGAISEEYIWM